MNMKITPDLTHEHKQRHFNCLTCKYQVLHDTGTISVLHYNWLYLGMWVHQLRTGKWQAGGLNHDESDASM